jgi:hypothetical protein
MTDFLVALQATPFADWVLTSTFGYYALLAGHALGMAIVVGTVFMLCLRVLGFAKDQPLLQFERLFGFAAAGFVLNLGTGLTLFAANGPNLAKNPPFLLKISLIVLGGVFLLLLWRRVMSERAVIVDAGGPASTQARALALITFGLWLCAIMAGRLIAYTIDY